MNTSRTTIVMQVLLGLQMLVFGANRLIEFMPEPPWPAEAQAFLDALREAGFVLPLLGAVDVCSGVALLVNRFVPVALLATIPVLVNAVLFHLALAPATSLFALLSAALSVALLWRYRVAYMPLLRPGAAPPRCEPGHEVRA